MNNRIKELRKQKKITQDELAKAVEVTRQTIISLENGIYRRIYEIQMSSPDDTEAMERKEASV